VGYEPRLAHPKVRSVSFGVEAKIFDLHDGPVESARGDVELFGITMENEFHASLWWAHEEEELFEDFDILDDGSVVIGPGTYRFNSYSLYVSTNEGAPLSGSLYLVAGEFYDGDRFESDLSVRLRPGRHFRAETSWGLRDVELPEGNFETNIYSQRFEFSFTADMGASLFAQYNDADDEISVNARFQWRYRPGSDLFIVFNENWDAPGFNDRTTRDRRITLKLTHLFQF
jgi:hypothetical protein